VRDLGFGQGDCAGVLPKPTSARQGAPGGEEVVQQHIVDGNRI